MLNVEGRTVLQQFTKLIHVYLQRQFHDINLEKSSD